MRVIYEPKGRAGEYAKLAVNLYRGCDHGCCFCYAPSVLKMSRADFSQPCERPGLLHKLKRDAAELQNVCDDRPILLCFSTDPYQLIDEDLQITRCAIEILKAHGRTVEILTKGGMRAERDFDLLDNGDAYAATLTFKKPDDSWKWEPRAEVPRSRLQALWAAKKRGLRTWVSMEPVIDPAQSLDLIRITAHDGIVDLYKLGAWNYDARAKEIDWISYYYKAIEIIEKAGGEYFVKDDLLKLVERGYR